MNRSPVSFSAAPDSNHPGKHSRGSSAGMDRETPQPHATDLQNVTIHYWALCAFLWLLPLHQRYNLASEDHHLLELGPSGDNKLGDPYFLVSEKRLGQLF